MSYEEEDTCSLSIPTYQHTYIYPLRTLRRRDTEEDTCYEEEDTCYMRRRIHATHLTKTRYGVGVGQDRDFRNDVWEKKSHMFSKVN
jgi:hypothetical protein